MEKLILKSQDNNLLKVNYSKCLNDENFLELVNSLEIDSNIKMKYTSRLKESAIENSNCKNCKNFLGCQNNIKGYCLTPNVLENSISFIYKKCEYKEKIDKQNEYLKHIYFY